MSLKKRIHIWLLNRGWVKVKPWEDPRRPAHDRAQWVEAEPKSLRKAG